MGLLEVRELRQLRDENARLKRLVADLTLDRHVLQEVIKKDLATRRRRDIARWIRDCFQLSVRRVLQAELPSQRHLVLPIAGPRQQRSAAADSGSGHGTTSVRVLSLPVVHAQIQVNICISLLDQQVTCGHREDAGKVEKIWICMGCKGSEVQILSPRPILTLPERLCGPVHGPHFRPLIRRSFRPRRGDAISEGPSIRAHRSLIGDITS
jgi:hypothetical protein